MSQGFIRCKVLLGRYTLSATCTGYYGYGAPGGEGAGRAADVDVSSPGGFEHAKAGPGAAPVRTRVDTAWLQRSA